MKTLKSMSNLFVVGLTSALLFTSCELAENLKQDEDILPNSFSVDIPASLSNQNSVKNGRVSGRVKTDTLQGNDVYLHLNTFIAVGEGAAHIVEGIIAGIRIYKIDRIQSLTYTSDDDHRAKNLIVLSNTEYENQMWDYELIITDADSENQADGGKALQIFWNKSATVKGIAIIKPYNCDRIKNAGAKNAVFRIDYSEESALGYDAEMQVSISGLPLESPLDNPYSVNTLRMFAGKKGDVVDVYGNTNHPNAIFFSGNTGFNWAFVASGNDVKDIGVAEVGLPPSDLDKSDRDVLLKEYSIKNVFTSEITSVWPGIDQNLLAAYLSNTPAPGYFDNRHGFIAGGVSPGPDWDVLTSRLTKLSPYNPKITSEMVVTFK